MEARAVAGSAPSWFKSTTGSATLAGHLAAVLAVAAEAAEALYSIPGSAKRTLGGIGANEGRETYATTGVMYKLIAPAVQH